YLNSLAAKSLSNGM
ncbi:quinolinate phosphoribosyl transferase, N-terminal domain protein, partial [Vibrio parahaemolyticus V-223/04]